MLFFQNIEEVKNSKDTLPKEELDKSFTVMVVECKGSTGCSASVAEAIHYMSEIGAKCLEDIDSQLKLLNAYNNYANLEEKANMEILCSNINFKKSDDDISSDDELDNVEYHYNKDDSEDDSLIYDNPDMNDDL